jgi:hypothetical protein
MLGKEKSKVTETAKMAPRFTVIKELAKIEGDTTTYLHINIKYTNENITDTSIIYIKNWNFCFYPGSRLVEGLNYVNGALWYLADIGRDTIPENIIILTDNYALQYAKNCHGCIRGGYNQFCFPSDFRKLCGKDTLQVDFWISESNLVNSINFFSVIDASLFERNSKTLSADKDSIPREEYEKIPNFREHELYIHIKNPRSVSEGGYYRGHCYQHDTTINNCKEKYTILRSHGYIIRY